MEYRSVEQARAEAGLRLVLTADNPGPWGEAAKALFKVKKLPFVPVRQEAGGDNQSLWEWIRHRNAPVAVYDGESPRAHWLELIQLAERLNPDPPLVPARMSERMQMIGLLHELAGDRGFAWYRRLLIFAPLMQDAGGRELVGSLATRYGYSEAELELAESRCVEVLALLSETLRQQQARGQRYFVGEQLSALDLYWAAFSNMFQPLPAEHCPMNEATRRAYAELPSAIAQAGDPLLLSHRDHVWRDVIGLPMDF